MKDYSKYSDKELVAIFKEDSEHADDAFREVYSRYAPRVNAYCLRVLGNRQQADDVFQETFIRFYERVKTSYKTGTIRGFLITIARNLCLNQKRDKKSNIAFEEYHSIISDNLPGEREELYNIITSSLDLLDFEYKEPLVLRIYDGMSYKEIAEICDISPENARKRVFRAKKQIKEIIEPYYKEI